MFYHYKIHCLNCYQTSDVIEDQFYQRWNMLTTDLHYVGTLFYPYLLGEVCLHDDVDAKEALNIVL
jgi:hypothetical protein